MSRTIPSRPGSARANEHALKLLAAWRAAPEHLKPAAMDRLLYQFRPLMCKALIRAGYTQSDQEWGDCLQDAAIVMMRHLERYDPDYRTSDGKPVRMTSYLTECLVKKMRTNGIRSATWSPVHIPAYMADLWNRMQGAMLCPEYEEAPNKSKWLADRLHATVKQVEWTIENVMPWKAVTCLDHQSDMPSQEIPDSTHDPAVMLAGSPCGSKLAEIAPALETLKPMDRDFLLVWAGGKTMEEVGKKYGISRTRVQDRIKRAVRRVRIALDLPDAHTSPIKLTFAHAR